MFFNETLHDAHLRAYVRNFRGKIIYHFLFFFMVRNNAFAHSQANLCLRQKTGVG